MRHDPLPSLLHNMSAPPKTLVTWQGLGGLVGQGAGRTSAAYPTAHVHGRAIRFTLPDDCATLAPAALLERIGMSAGKSAVASLTALIEKRAAGLPLPDGCVVVPPQLTDARPLPDLLSALAVITKSSEAVWLRSKTPTLSVLRRRRSVTLLLPPQFANLIEEDTR